MRIMQCFGSFKNDRTCDLCDISNYKQYIRCKHVHELENEIYKTINIKNCEHKKEGIKDYTYYTDCNLFGGTCEPSSKCKKKEYNEAIDLHNKIIEKYVKDLKDMEA